jgi:hypothetical protein
MNALCRWLHEQGEAPTLVKLRPQRLEKRIIRTHGEAALRIVLGYRPKTFEHSRVHALILTILGHSDVSTTTKYLHLLTEDVQRTHQGLSVLAQLRR